MANRFTVSFRVVDRASNSFRRIARSTVELERATASASQKFASMAQVTLATTGAMVAGFTSAASAAGEVEDALARLETVTKGTTNQMQTALQNAKAAALDFSTSFTASTTELIEAQFQIATAGVAVEEQIAATQGAFKLAIATQGTFAQSTQLLGSLLNTFGKSAEFNYLAPGRKVEALTDKLSMAVQRFQVTLPVLAESLKFVIGPASTLGLKFSEVTSALGVLNTAGFRGSLAGTALSNMFNKLDRAIEMLDLDPSKFTDLNGNLKDMASFLEEVERGLEGMTSIEVQNKLIEVFDIRAGRVVKTLLNQVGAIRKNTIEMELNRGATEKMARVQQGTLNASTKKASNAFNNLAITIGDMVTPALKEVMQGLTTFANSITGALNSLGPFGKTLLVSIASLATFVAGVVAARVALRALAATGLKQVAQRVIFFTTNLNVLTYVIFRRTIPAIWRWASTMAGVLIRAIFAVGAALTVNLIANLKAFGRSIGIAITAIKAWSVALWGQAQAVWQSTIGTIAFNKALQSLMVTIVVGTVGIAALLFLIGELVAMFTSFGGEIHEVDMALAGMSDTVVGLRGGIGQFVDEMQRIQKIGDADVPMFEKGQVGVTKITQLFDEMQSSTGRTGEQVENLERHLAGLSDSSASVNAFVLGMEHIFEGGRASASKFAVEMEDTLLSTSTSFKKMGIAARSAEIGTKSLELLGIQTLLAAGGNEELSQSIGKVADALRTLDTTREAIIKYSNVLEDGNATDAAKAFAERMKEGLENQIAPLQKELAELILNEDFTRQLKRLADRQNPFVESLLNTLEREDIQLAIIESTEGAIEAVGKTFDSELARQKLGDKLRDAFVVETGFSNIVSELTNATSQIEAIFKKVEEGTRTAASGMADIDKQLTPALQNLDKLSKLIPEDIAKAQIRLGVTEESLDKVKGELQDKINEIEVLVLRQKLERESKEFAVQISKMLDKMDLGPLKRRMTEVVKSYGEDLSDASSTFLRSGDKIQFATDIGDLLQQNIFKTAEQGLSQLIGVAFGPAQERLKKEMAEALSPNNIDLGNLDAIGSRVIEVLSADPVGRALLSQMERVTGPFSKKLMEDLKDARLDLNILQARRDIDSVTRSFANELERLTQGALDSTNTAQIEQAIRGAMKLLGEATAAGADNTVTRLIEAQIKSLKAAAEQAGDSKLFGILEKSSVRVETAMDRSVAAHQKISDSIGSTVDSIATLDRRTSATMDPVPLDQRMVDAMVRRQIFALRDREIASPIPTRAEMVSDTARSQANMMGEAMARAIMLRANDSVADPYGGTGAATMIVQGVQNLGEVLGQFTTALREMKDEVATQIEEGRERVRRGQESAEAKHGTRSTDIQVEGNTANINVSIESSGGGEPDITQQDLEQLGERVRGQLEEFVESSMRSLNEYLEGLIRGR